ncbi:hypothetical protein [Hymenobacter elongatus]|uniref:Uncharacterized protein n=1 Tax=Hymenobacter elongatus TaxID=877208 RepID=A0A4Z0PJD3_9BACT|nr:hypothetical protein [Hymenobacter elongatus]TGE14447.1 hypothetical protein E5J99_15920 [Hymenobacter elongatus]
MRAGLLLLTIGLLLPGFGATAADRGGEAAGFRPLLNASAHTLHRPAFVMLPDTTKPILRPDSVVAAPALAWQPTVDDADKPTRKTSLRIAVAIAVLTVTTLLLYNVRSR